MWHPTSEPGSEALRIWQDQQVENSLQSMDGGTTPKIYANRYGDIVA